ncbi:NADH-dependent flavin oxidoreductase [Salinicoccus sp. ID82-1]|uniref:NADH-dependent flavin oxidoreductase n=1 Tax=Salinicoccus sp. ID82-1 TaxID=2820269 RepID=UPI001F3497C6|nr:NADH-dependent flavin oxidoreductase [Salinicoccus sp. ID82-1]MCG1010721.1 NADH-dependent flavin oxidoreductase [Salinicoccus sp. ID82-1]
MNTRYAPLFEGVQLPNGVELKNKFVLAPLTHVSSNDDGTPTDAEIEYMRKRSNGVGLALTAATNVTDLGKAFPGQPSIVRDSDIEEQRKIADAMKANGAKAIMQIHHGGVQALPSQTATGESAGPSAITMQSFGEPEPHDAREITPEEIDETIKAFGEATRRAIEAGFDGVEIHGANHYIIHQFVSPYFNKRTDKWGEDRYLFAMEVVDEVVKTVKEHGNPDFIIGYRFSPEEPQTPGIDMEITETLIGKLVEKPLDYLHVSLFDVHSTTRDGKYVGIERIELLHKWIGGRMPLIGIGSIFTPDQALEAVESGNVDLLGLGRALLLDPDFVNKIEDGKEEEITNVFDPERADKHELTEPLWEQFYKGFYPVPRKDQ